MMDLKLLFFSVIFLCTSQLFAREKSAPKPNQRKDVALVTNKEELLFNNRVFMEAKKPKVEILYLLFAFMWNIIFGLLQYFVLNLSIPFSKDRLNHYNQWGMKEKYHVLEYWLYCKRNISMYVTKLSFCFVAWAVCFGCCFNWIAYHMIVHLKICSCKDGKCLQNIQRGNIMGTKPQEQITKGERQRLCWLYLLTD